MHGAPVTDVRLESAAPGLNTYIRSLPEDQRRRIAWEVAKWSLSKVPVSDPRIDDLVLSPLPIVDESRRPAVEALCLELDEAAWDIQDLVDEGRAEYAAYVAAFERARAVNALCEAMNPDASRAASEGIYEALAATDDPDGISALVRSVG